MTNRNTILTFLLAALPIAAMNRQEIHGLWEGRQSENHLTGDGPEYERALQNLQRFRGNTGKQIARDAINKLHSWATQATVGTYTSGLIFSVGTLVTIMTIPSPKHIAIAAVTTLTLTGCTAGYAIIKARGAEAAHHILDMLARTGNKPSPALASR